MHCIPALSRALYSVYCKAGSGCKRWTCMPRHAMTAYASYCLQPAACQYQNLDVFLPDLCDESIFHLHQGRVSPFCLVCMDTGSILPRSLTQYLDLACLSDHDRGAAPRFHQGYMARDSVLSHAGWTQCLSAPLQRECHCLSKRACHRHHDIIKPVPMS